MTDDQNGYVDIREQHPDYTTIPCIKCDGALYVQRSFAYNHDEWYCSDCKPEELRDVGGGCHVEVNL